MDTQLISLFEAAQANAKAILPLLQKLEGYSPVAYTAETILASTARDKRNSSLWKTFLGHTCPGD